MARILLIIAAGVVIVFGVVFFLSRQPNPLAIPAPSSVAALEAASTPSTEFSQSGTLVFYPNNMGPVPYLYYPDAGGKTVAKALTFANSPPHDFSSWAGAHISVVGHREQEHVIVTKITYLSGP